MAASTKTLESGGVGSFAISTIDFDTWMNEPAAKTASKTRKNKVAKEIVNKIFTDCAAAVSDPFWIEKFNLAAAGKLPQKFSYHENILSYKKGNRTFSVELSNNPHDAAAKCMEFFRAHAGMFSPQDEQNSLELQYQRTHAALSEEPLTWGDANKKIQESLLSNFITTMKEIMNLSESEKEQLRQTIRLGIGNKYFGKHNISVQQNSITSIEGLLWNDSGRFFYIHPELKPVTTRSYSRKKESGVLGESAYKDMAPQFTARWARYLEILDKKIAKHARGHRVTIVQSDVSTTSRVESTTETSTLDDED